jgi:putative aminopeptidase FrvX
MNKELLKTVLSIPSVYKREELVRDYIKTYAENNGIVYHIDAKGNIYLTKGEITEDEFYPCVVAHMDTVHTSQSILVDKDLRLQIVESQYEVDEKTTQTVLTARYPETGKQTGIGGDDKCGVAVCLEMLNHFDVLKAAFFVEEEIGMNGSRVADMEFFENVGYAIQFDAPSDNWITEVCSGVKLFGDEFKGLITETLSNGGYTTFSRDPFTDVNQLAQKFDFCCLNLGCGYHRQHTDLEYVIVEEVENAVKVGISLIEHLGVKYYHHEKPQQLNEWSTSAPWWDTYDEEEELGLMAENIADSVIEMIAQGADRDDVREFIYDYLEENSYY